ncbi:hypothetical protein ABTY20_03605 [Streptomyces sp. NPDC126497]|uniref:hypothetical protein n=1 Tax=Streptomyces sp. NPDC126497 TaxID=3155313 RepID=UPI00332BB5FB
MSSLLNGMVLFVKHGPRLLQGDIDVIEGRVIVSDRLQPGLSNPWGLLLRKVTLLLPCPLL